MTLTPQQVEAITVDGRALLVEAGAGTGKTSVLKERFLSLLDRHPDWSLDGIVAVTFTEKATREMRQRIREGIEERARQPGTGSQWQRHRRDLDRLQVSTIHSLCARILRENPIAAGIDPRFTVLDEQDAEVLKEEAIRRALAELATGGPGVPAGLDGAGPEAAPLDLLAALQVRDLHDELAALLDKRGTVDRLFAGLEEPATLLKRWRAGVAEMQRTAWQERIEGDANLREALETLPRVVVGDPADRLAEAVLLAQEGCRLLETGDWAGAVGCFKTINRNGGRQTAWGGTKALEALKARLGAVQAAGKALDKEGIGGEVGSDDETAAAGLAQWQALWRLATGAYDELKSELQALDFDDLELFAERLLRQDPREPRLAEYLGELRHVMVDEFQDVNELQGRIIYSLAHPADGGRLFAVGDAKQSIYRFRQAQVRVFNRLAQDIERYTGCRPLPLSRSFRAHASLVAALNAAFENILQPVGPDYQPFEARPGALSWERDSLPPHLCALAPVEVLLLPREGDAEETRRSEARILAERLRELHRARYPVWDRDARQHRDFRYGDAAILFRATTSLPLYEEEFQRAGLPYLTVSGRGYYNRPEVRTLIALIAALYAPGDDLNLAAALRSPLFSLSDETLYLLRWRTAEGGATQAPRPYAEALARRPPTPQDGEVEFAAGIMRELWEMAGRVDAWRLLRTALDRTGYEATLALADEEQGGGESKGRARSNVAKFMALAREWGSASLSDFLQRVEDLQAREAREGEAPGAEPDAGAVQLMSVHAAKGLEWPVVVVADLGRAEGRRGTAPHILHDPQFGLVCQLRDAHGEWAKPANYRWAEWLNRRMELAESRRVLYVACTRAADLLILSGKSGEQNSWLRTLLGAWGLEEGEEGERIAEREGYRLRIVQASASQEPEPAERPHATIPQAPELVEMPALALRAPDARWRRPVAVTHLERRLAEEAGELPRLHPAVTAVSDGGAGREVAGYVIGSLAHRALADWDCLSLPLGERRAKLLAWASRAGIADLDAAVQAVDRVEVALDGLQRSSLFGDIAAAAERYAETPFSLETPVGLLHGVIDLLYRDAGGEWRLVDWKTEPVRAGEEVGEAAAAYLLQVALYRKAAQQCLGISPAVDVCFLDGQARMHRFTDEELEEAWRGLVAGQDHRPEIQSG